MLFKSKHGLYCQTLVWHKTENFLAISNFMLRTKLTFLFQRIAIQTAVEEWSTLLLIKNIVSLLLLPYKKCIFTVFFSFVIITEQIVKEYSVKRSASRTLLQKLPPFNYDFYFGGFDLLMTVIYFFMLNFSNRAIGIINFVKLFSNFYCRHQDLVSEFKCGLKLF